MRILLWAALPGSLTGQAPPKPLLEVGAGFAAADFPLYRGSSDRKAYLIPFPHVVYRGEKLQVNAQEVQGLLYRSERLELDLSLNGSIPVKSRDSRERQGMPDLRPTLEVGPVLTVHLLAAERMGTRLDLDLPVRSVIASDLSHSCFAGWVGHPKMTVTVHPPGFGDWKVGLSAGAIWADATNLRYTYAVEPAYATPTRRAYEAKGGFAGTQLMLTLSARTGRRWAAGFLKWDDLSGAVIADSPLVGRSRNLTAGFALTWMVFQSRKTTTRYSHEP